MIVIVFLVFTGTQDTQDNTNKAEVVQEDQIALQSNLPVSPPRQSHFVTAATLEEDGYDSDKESNPNTTITNEDSMEVDELALPKVGEESGMAGEQETHENGGEFVDIEEATLKKLKVAELKEELSKHGQSTQGLKAVLLEQLREALGKRLPVLAAADRSARTTDDLKGFAPTACWKPLVPQAVPVSEPQNIVGTMHAPTVPSGDAAFLLQKHDFAEVFDCQPFIGKEKVQCFHWNG